MTDRERIEETLKQVKALREQIEAMRMELIAVIMEYAVKSNVDPQPSMDDLLKGNIYKKN